MICCRNWTSKDSGERALEYGFFRFLERLKEFVKDLAMRKVKNILIEERKGHFSLYPG